VRGMEAEGTLFTDRGIREITSPVVEPALAGRRHDRAMIRRLVDPCDRRRAA